MFGSPQHRDEEMGLPVGLGVGAQLLKEVIKNIYQFVGGVERHRTPVYMTKNMKIKQLRSFILFDFMIRGWGGQ